MSHTIAAVSTGHQVSAIGILRLSGDGCIEIAQKVFSGRVPLTQAENRKLELGELHDTQGRVIDQCMAVVSRAPHSYTGEDTVEFHCHGSPALLAAALESLYAAGARPAQRGEFTKRAFLNGKLDLTQAEAVIDLIEAETADAAANAAGQVGGTLKRALEPIYDNLTDLCSHFHAVLDYPDEDIEDFGLDRYAGALRGDAKALYALLSTYQQGRILKQGAAAAIVGRPNVGKSSLLNALAGFDRVIVTDIPGTTRDTVEETVTCGGTLLRLIDTAGIHDTADAVEQLGVERSRKAAETADLVIAVVDGSQTPMTVDEDILALAAKAPHWILAVSKDDLNPAVKTAVWQLPKGLREPDALVSFNSVAPGGLDALVDAIQDCFPAGAPAEAGSLLTNARQADAVRRALSCVKNAHASLQFGMTPDVVLTDAEGALEALGELNGKHIREDLVDTIFSRFCVGK